MPGAAWPVGSVGSGSALWPTVGASGRPFSVPPVQASVSGRPPRATTPRFVRDAAVTLQDAVRFTGLARPRPTTTVRPDKGTPVPLPSGMAWLPTAAGQQPAKGSLPGSRYTTAK